MARLTSATGVKKIEAQWERGDANNRTALKGGSGTLMREKNQRKMFFRDREGKEGRGWETRDEEAQQLNIPQPVVNSEWGRKTMSPLILRARSLLFRRQVQPQVGGKREREREKNQSRRPFER